MPRTRAPKATAATSLPLPPPPRRTPVLDAATGLMQRAWVTWLELSYRRQGEAHAPSNAELDDALTGTEDAVAALQAELAATQAELAATQAELAATQAELAATQAELETTQGELDTAEVTIVALQAELDATQATMAALVPDGTARAVARYQADGSGVEASTGVVIDETGRLGVGQATPLTPLHVVGEVRAEQGLFRAQRDATNAAAIIETSTDTATIPALLQLARARGTTAARTAVQSGDLLARCSLRGFGTAMGDAVNLEGHAEETFSATVRGARLTIATVALGTVTMTERVRIDSQGRIGLCNTGTPTAPLDVNGNTLRLRTARTPASATAAGNAGDICWDAAHLFVCVATNTWRRMAHATW